MTAEKKFFSIAFVFFISMQLNTPLYSVMNQDSAITLEKDSLKILIPPPPVLIFESNLVSISRAINLLGKDKVITAEQAAQVWNRPATQNSALRYNEQTIRECAEANKKGEDWRLIYILGFSIWKQRDVRGTDVKSQPCFSLYSIWWLDEEKQRCENRKMVYWVSQTAESGYYLFNFNGQFGGKTRDKQEELITQLGPNFVRAPDRS